MPKASKAVNTKPEITSEILNGFIFNLCENLLTRFFAKLSSNDWMIKRATTVHHYTSIQTLYHIIESQSLIATNALYLNDKNEYRQGIYAYKFEMEHSDTFKKSSKLVRDLVSHIYPKLDSLSVSDYYVTCFSAEQDLLSQWNAYGDSGSGVSISFNIDALAGCFQHRIRGSWINYDLYKKLKRVQIINNEFFKGYSRLVREFRFKDEQQILEVGAELYLKHLVPVFVSSHKDRAFEQEHEYRFALKNEMGTDLDIEFMVKNNKTITPFTRLILGEKYWKDQYDKMPPKQQPAVLPTSVVNKLPITEIMLGPLVDEAFVTPGLKMYLESRGYGAVKISKSSIPLR